MESGAGRPCAPRRIVSSMSFSTHMRGALNASLPISHRMSHLRSCAMLVGQKHLVRRSVVIESVRSRTGIDISNPIEDDAIRHAVEMLRQLRESGLGETNP